MKTKSSSRYIIIDDFLLGGLLRWQAQQAENETMFGDTYVYIYYRDDGHITRQSKGLPIPEGEKIDLICLQKNGKLILREYLTKLLKLKNLGDFFLRLYR